MKDALIQSFIPNDEPVLIPMQQFHPISFAIAKNKHMTAERVLMDHLLNHKGPVDQNSDACRSAPGKDRYVRIIRFSATAASLFANMLAASAGSAFVCSLLTPLGKIMSYCRYRL